ncbi:MAG: M48 family metalloprotease [Candidatus Latescibacteria bacterium]|nr:M48 family metalloprotease [Candidatus Latescibacterota bacterium]
MSFPRMRESIVLLLLIGCVCVAAGCGPSLKRVQIPAEEVRAERAHERETAFSILQERQRRLLDVAYPLLIAATALCKDTAQITYGFELHDKKSYGKKYEDIAARYYRLDDGVVVRYVHPSLPAASAGLQVGDRVVAVNGQRVEGKKLDEIRKLIQQPDPILRLRIERQTQAMELEVRGVPTCPYRVRISDLGEVNAFANGDDITVNSGMIRFAATDEDLALVVGHEIAHNVLRHSLKKLGYLLTGLAVEISVLIGRQAVHNETISVLMDIYIYGAPAVFMRLMGRAFSKTFEAEADYAGLYITARAGYDITHASQFWRRLATEYPRLIERRFLATHPTTPERFLALQKAAQEIQEKRQRGQSLIPEKKD